MTYMQINVINTTILLNHFFINLFILSHTEVPAANIEIISTFISQEWTSSYD